MATWYVAPTGTTTTQAGTRDNPFLCSAINWTSIAAGDTVYLRTAFGNYNETLTIGKSGTAGNYITIDSDPLDGGKAVIDGQNTRLEGITNSAKTYIIIKNIIAKNTTGANNRGFLPGNYWKFYNIEAENCYFGIAFSGNIDVFVDGGLFTNCDRHISVSNCTSTVTIKNVSCIASAAYNGILQISGTSTNALITLQNIILNGGNAGSVTNQALLFLNSGTYTAGSKFENITIKNGTYKGFYCTSVNGFTVNNLTITNCLLSGADISTGVHDVIFNDCKFNANADDGIDFTGDSYNITLNRCVANGNGYPTPNDPVNSGDGFSAHGTCYNINQYFCVAAGNRNSGYAHVNTSAGVLYHCTSAFNGNQAGSTVRAGIFINTTGDNPTAAAGSKSWKMKNSISYKDYPRNLYFTAAAIGSTSWAFDYNSYKPLDDATFATIDGGSTNISWTTYKASYEANSKNEDGKVAVSGMLASDSPCIDAAPWMSGFNDGGQSDPWGKKVYGLPNTGADQGAGMPYGGRLAPNFGNSIR